MSNLVAAPDAVRHSDDTPTELGASLAFYRDDLNYTTVTHAPCGLSTLRPDAGNFFRLDSQPLQETPVCVRVAGLKQLVPAHASLLVHAALP